MTEIHNTGPSARTFTLSTSNVPAGFKLVYSGTTLTVPAGETGSLGLYLFPTTAIPAPGSQYTFRVSVKSGSTINKDVTFTVPEIHAITLVPSASSVTAAPGFSWSGAVTITAAGNVAENVRLSAASSDGITVGGLNDVSLQPGQSVTESFTVVVDPSTPLNQVFGVTINAEAGSLDAPVVQSQRILVTTVIPGARSISAAGDSASKLGETAIAGRLFDLGTQLTNLVLDPSNPAHRGQVAASLDTIAAFIPNDPYLVPLLSAFTNDRKAIAAATTPGDLSNAITQLGVDLDAMAKTLADEVAHGLTIKLDPSQGTARSNVAVYFPIGLTNIGNQTTTYDLSVVGLPASVTASFNRSSITLQPGQSVLGGADGATLSLTETGGDLIPTNFRVVATAHDAPEISRSTNGTMTIPTQFFEITSVDVTPTFANTAKQVSVSAIFYVYASNFPSAKTFFTVVDAGGGTVLTSTPVSLPQSLGAKYNTVQLGRFDSSGLTDGTYTIVAHVVDASGNSLTGSNAYTTFLVGQPVTARLTTYDDRTSGKVDATTPGFNYAQGFPVALSLSAQTTFPAPLTLKSVTETGSAATSIAIKGARAYVGGPAGITIVDIASPANPSVVGTFGSSDVTQGAANSCVVAGNSLFVVSQGELNATSFKFLIYSLSDLDSPVLLSSTQLNFRFAGQLVIDGDTAYVSLSGISVNLFLDLSDQFGDYLAARGFMP